MTVELVEQDALGLDRLESVGLMEVLDRAELLDRVDRKYVVPLDVAQRLIRQLADDHKVLTIGDRHTTNYRTTYFDTDDLQCVRDHVKGRRRRFKARSRLYVEDHLCQLEVKTKSRRGKTLKMRQQMRASDYGTMTASHRRFIDETLAESGIDFTGPLGPTLEICTTRGTLVDLDNAVRITFDRNVTCRQGSDGIALDPRFVVVETKGSKRAGRADRALWRAGHRPRSFSKYTTAGSLLEPSIADNAIRSMLGTQLHRQGAA